MLYFQSCKMCQKVTSTHFNLCKNCFIIILQKRIQSVFQGAKKRNLEFNLHGDFIASKMIEKCYYCSNNSNFCGLDRINNALGYTRINIVPACKKCNMAKASSDPISFISHTRCVATPGLFRQKKYQNNFTNTRSSNFTSLKNSAKFRKLEMTISKELFEKLVKSVCYYCRKENINNQRNGIDRLNNAFGYIPNNVVAACNNCNMRKGSLNEEEFVTLCQKISETHQDEKYLQFFHQIPTCAVSIFSREKSLKRARKTYLGFDEGEILDIVFE